MRRINLLSEETANKIAAGEVVERASSVVKEIVENSLDAGSTNVTIEIEESGSKLIRVTDDGIGIHPEDIKTAFLPHGTSKIASLEDIYTMNSFGFRGEALPSIAAISKVKLKSRPWEYEYGREISIEGGKIIELQDVGCNPGTEIEIQDLFFNTPARQKFLKSPQREKSIINDLVLKLALGNFKTSISLISDGKQVLKTYGDDEIDKVIRVLYGKEVQENILSLENHSDILSVYGFVGNENIARGSRNRQSIFINKRLIKSSLITAAVENAYKSFYPGNKFPFFAIYIDIFPEYIDPNVHPTKAEIKFLEERLIFKTVFDAVHNALRDSLRKTFEIEDDSIEEISSESVLRKPDVDVKQLDYINEYEALKRENNSSFLKESIMASEKNYCSDAPVLNSNSKNMENDSVREEYTSNKEENIVDRINDNNIIKSNEINNDIPKAKFPRLNLVGQCFNSYIIAEYEDELYMVDQHAAHEKILFERYKKHIKESSVNSQILAVPAIINLTYEEFGIYKENIEIFKNSGFAVEDFGDSDVIVREVPLFLGTPHIDSLFHEIIDNIRSMGSGLTVDVKYNKIATLACKAAVKAHDKLTDIEMKALLEELRFIDEPFNCPHGRPTILKYKLKDIEKSFKRIM